MSLRLFALLSLPFIFLSCSTISKKDCGKNMTALGLEQGRAGSPKKYTDKLRDTCSNHEPAIDLEAYEKGFYQGWSEYCTPVRAFELGQRADRYFSFCPAEQESLFREKYLMGKQYAELKELEADMVEKQNEMKPHMNDSAQNLNDYSMLQKEIDKTRRDLQALEVQVKKSSFKLR